MRWTKSPALFFCAFTEIICDLTNADLRQDVRRIRITWGSRPVHGPENNPVPHIDSYHGPLPTWTCLSMTYVMLDKTIA